MAFPTPRAFGPLYGTHDGNRGAQGRIAPCTEIELLKLENGATEGQPLGIALSIATRGKLTATELTRASGLLPLPRARVYWGAGHSRTFVDVDFGTGVGLTLTAESLAIEAHYAYAAAPWAEEDICDTSCLPVYDIQATIGYGSYCCRSTLTEVAFVEVPTEKTSVAVPPFARSFSVLPISGASVKAHMRGYGDFYTVENVIVTPLSNTQQNAIDNIPIPNGIRRVEIENVDDAPVAAFVVFSIGI